MFPASVHVASFASVLVRLCPSAATTVSSWLISVSPFSSLKIFPHVPQVQYAMFPASVQVAAFASVLLKSWPAATTVSDWLISCVPSLSLNSFLQIPQVQYSMFPASVHVASFASVFSRLWIVLSSLWLSSLLQVLIAKPSSSSVAGFTSVHSPQAWPVAATTVSFDVARLGAGRGLLFCLA